MNWADLFIISAVLLFALTGYYKGAFRQIADLLSLLFSIFLSVSLYAPFAIYLTERFSVNPSIAKMGAFFIIWVLTQFIFNLIFHFLYPLVPEKIRKSKINKFSGAVPGALWGTVFVSIVITIVVALPLKSPAKDTIVDSLTGKYIIGKTAFFESYISNALGDALDETLTFRTVNQKSGETTDLGFTVTADNLSVDEESEQRMLELVNKERVKRGYGELTMDDELVRLARAHSKDMFERGYFSHDNPDGEDPFDRMKRFSIEFRVAGENLALAPNVELAHEGLMNSPGHRANILTAEFGMVGIGCIDGGSYGKMFSQEFTN